MTTYPRIAATSDATVLPQGAADLLTGEQENIWCTSQDLASPYYIAGALKPWPGIQDGVLLTDGLKGLTPGFKHVDLKSARQPGVTWTGTVYDVLEIDMDLEAHASTAAGISQVVSEWVSMWDPTQLNTVEYWTIDRGYWYLPARLSKPFPDAIKQMPRLLRKKKFTQSIRCDSGFWLGMPSIASFAPGGSGGSGFLRLSNIGDQPAWPTILFYGPGTFKFSNGFGSPNMITFGPLNDGQVVLMRTLPRMRTISDLTTAPVTLTAGEQKLLDVLSNFVTNNNIPPLVSWFESLVGAFTPHTPLWSLLNGRYTTPIPGVRQPSWATMSGLTVSISGGNTHSKIVARIDPQRRWPE